MSEKIRIRDVCSRFSSGKAISASRVYEEGKYPVYGGNGLRGYTDTYNFDGECAVIGRQGAYCGNVKFFSGKGYMTEHAVVAVANQHNNSRFLAYKFALMDLGRYAGQSAQPGLSVETLLDVEIDVPEKDIQDDIARVLSTLDAKIDSNSAICTNLEAMAKLLYDYWFVQFDFPDENGKPYKSSGGKMVWNEELKREIPAGWEVKHIGDYDTRVGGTPSRKEKEYWENGTIPWITTGEINNSVISVCNECITVSGMRHSAAKKIPARSIIMAMYGAGTAGRVGYLPYPATTNQACCSIVCRNDYESAFIYFFCKSIWNYINSIITGSIQQNLNKETIDAFGFACPPDSVMELSHLDIIMAKLVELNEENQQLASLRDFLLPMLMNGQVKVGKVGA